MLASKFLLPSLIHLHLILIRAIRDLRVWQNCTTTWKSEVILKIVSECTHYQNLSYGFPSWWLCPTGSSWFVTSGSQEKARRRKKRNDPRKNRWRRYLSPQRPRQLPIESPEKKPTKNISLILQVSCYLVTKIGELKNWISEIKQMKTKRKCKSHHQQKLLPQSIHYAWTYFDLSKQLYPWWP